MRAGKSLRVCFFVWIPTAPLLYLKSCEIVGRRKISASCAPLLVRTSTYVLETRVAFSRVSASLDTLSARVAPFISKCARPLSDLCPAPCLVQVLPSVYAFIGRSLAAKPSDLGTLVLCRALVQALSSPFSGMLGDFINRKLIVGVGCLWWGFITCCIAAISNGRLGYYQAMAFWSLNVRIL